MTIAIVPTNNDFEKATPKAMKWLDSVRTTALFGSPVNPIEELKADTGAEIKIEYKDIHMRVKGFGGAVIINKDPQISPGFDGQHIALEGSDDTNTVEWQHGKGLQLKDAANVILKNGDMVELVYNKNRALWIEKNRSINRV